MRGVRALRTLSLAALAVVLAGCSGDILGVLPEAASAEAEEVDRLTYLIIWVTGVTLVGVQGVLIWFLFRHRKREGVPAKYTHGNHAVELVWTVAPALVLVLLAVYQADLWVRVKSKAPEDAANAVNCQIFAKQFEWRYRYPGPNGEYESLMTPPDETDDIVSLALVVPVDRPVLAQMRSMDVLHSFFLPNLRFKQDAVPGLLTNIWFRATKKSADRLPVKDRDGNEVQLEYWDVVCAELCGLQHSTMASTMYVVSNEDFENWLAGKPTSVELPAWNKIGPEGSTDHNYWVRWEWQETNIAEGPPRWKREPYGEDDLGPDAVSEDDEEDF